MDRIRLYLTARRVVLEEAEHHAILAVHHVGPCGQTSPSLIPKLAAPFIYGPVPDFEAARSKEGLSLWLGFENMTRLQTGATIAASSMLAPLARAVSRRTLATADAVTVEAKAHAPHNRPDATVIPMGLDLTMFTPGNGDRVQGRVVAVSALLRRKGLDILIRAIAMARLRNGSVHLMIAGEGPERRSLMKLSEELGIGSAVSFLGRVPRANLVDLYGSAVAFCHPARTDNFPTTVIEAMACGLAPLVSDFGALPEMVGEAGLIHPRGDAVCLQAQLLEVVERRTYSADLAHAARDRAVHRFSVDRMCDDYLSLYRRLNSAAQFSERRMLPRGET
jgi:glycosyltransferase involved in cell wall biosynthesis